MVQPSLSPDNPYPRAAFYTPLVTETPKQMERELTLLRWSLQVIGEAASKPEQEVGRVREKKKRSVGDICQRIGSSRWRWKWSEMCMIVVGWE